LIKQFLCQESQPGGEPARKPSYPVLGKKPAIDKKAKRSKKN